MVLCLELRTSNRRRAGVVVDRLWSLAPNVLVHTCTCTYVNAMHVIEYSGLVQMEVWIPPNIYHHISALPSGSAETFYPAGRLVQKESICGGQHLHLLLLHHHMHLHHGIQISSSLSRPHLKSLRSPRLVLRFAAASVCLGIPGSTHPFYRYPAAMDIGRRKKKGRRKEEEKKYWGLPSQKEDYHIPPPRLPRPVTCETRRNLKISTDNRCTNSPFQTTNHEPNPIGPGDRVWSG